MQPLLDPAQMQARIFFDLVYNPMETPSLRTARERGMEVISGVEMFVQQGVRQFEIWTGKPAPEDEMRRVVMHALGAAAGASPAAQQPPTVAPTSEQARPEVQGSDAKPNSAARKSPAKKKFAAKKAK